MVLKSFESTFEASRTNQAMTIALHSSPSIFGLVEILIELIQLRAVVHTSRLIRFRRAGKTTGEHGGEVFFGGFEL